MPSQSATLPLDFHSSVVTQDISSPLNCNRGERSILQVFLNNIYFTAMTWLLLREESNAMLANTVWELQVSTKADPVCWQPVPLHSFIGSPRHPLSMRSRLSPHTSVYVFAHAQYYLIRHILCFMYITPILKTVLPTKQALLSPFYRWGIRSSKKWKALGWPKCSLHFFSVQWF